MSSLYSENYSKKLLFFKSASYTSAMPQPVDVQRTLFKGGVSLSRQGPVFYWMSRDQRLSDNWALCYARQLALEKKVPLAIVFCLVSSFLGATERHYDFMLKGLEELSRECDSLNTPFFLLTGNPADEISRFAEKYKASAVVSDFSPLKINRLWKEEFRKKTKAEFFVVDAHNIVPCWVASTKLEFGAYTLRPKINRQLSAYLTEFPKLEKHPCRWPAPKPSADWIKARKTLQIDKDVKAVSWISPGEKAAFKALTGFVKNRLQEYGEARNDPAQRGQSNLSPYFHFGHLAPQRAALEALKCPASESRESFLEELIIRRELSDNFCYYQKDYEFFEGFPAWARETLNIHRKDKRPFLYSRDTFEHAATHDPYWNAAQLEMVQTGKMHGYMRMYWAKKILEWTESPEQALETAIYLNDKYELDGRDPNGYAGIAWSIGGVHDRPWSERAVFGKIRYMNSAGLDRKFEMKPYADAFVSKKGEKLERKEKTCPSQLSMDFTD